MWKTMLWKPDSIISYEPIQSISWIRRQWQPIKYMGKLSKQCWTWDRKDKQKNKEQKLILKPEVEFLQKITWGISVNKGVMNKRAHPMISPITIPESPVFAPLSWFTADLEKDPADTYHICHPHLSLNMLT